MHERHSGIWIVQSKHFAEVIVTSSSSSGSTLGGVHHIDAEQASRCHAILLEVVVTLVQITLGQAEQSFLLEHQIAIGLEHKDATAWLVSYGDELVANLAFEGWDQCGVGLFASFGHAIHFGWQFRQNLCRRSLSLLRDHHKGFNLRHSCRVENHGHGQNASVDGLDDVTDGTSHRICTLGSIQNNISLDLGQELWAVLLDSVVVLQSCDLGCRQLGHLRSYGFLDDAGFHVNGDRLTAKGSLCRRSGSSQLGQL